MDKKISLPEIIIMVLLSGGADFFEVFVGFAGVVPVIGQALTIADFFIGLTVLAIVQFWLIMKGGIGFRKQASALMGNIIELIPFLDILPIRTVTLLISIYLINKEDAKKDILVPTKKQAFKEVGKTMVSVAARKATMAATGGMTGIIASKAVGKMTGKLLTRNQNQ